MTEAPAYDIRPLLDALGRGDVELRFRDGRSIKAHSQKLSLASNGILRDLLEDVLEEEIVAKRRRTDLAGGASSSAGVMVRTDVHFGPGSVRFRRRLAACMAAINYSTVFVTPCMHPCRLMEGTRTGWRC